MDIQFWIWLAIIIITFLARAGKKKQQEMEESAPDREATDQQKPITFEDLLREIQASKSPAPPPPVTKPEPVQASRYQKPEPVVDYDDDLKDEVQEELETVTNYRREDEIYEVYEKAKREAFARPSLEETTKLEDTVVRFSPFKGYQRNPERRLSSPYLSELRDAEGFRKAFVMSEILKRKF
jgi:hypothetical protein